MYYEVTASSAANLLELQPNSIALFYHKLSKVIVYYLDQETHKIFGGAVELDESYLGGYANVNADAERQVKWLYLVFKCLAVECIPWCNTKTEILMPLIASKVEPDSAVYTDCYRSYYALDVSGFYYERINHSKLIWSGNGIESF